MDELMVTDQNANGSTISVTCHKRMEWDNCKIIVVGYSDGTLKVFDVNNLEMLRDLRRALSQNPNYMTIVTYMGDIVERIAVALDFGNGEYI